MYWLVLSAEQTTNEDAGSIIITLLQMIELCPVRLHVCVLLLVILVIGSNTA